MITVKISTRGAGRNLDISQYVGNPLGEWDGCRFLVNTDHTDVDVWFVAEDVDDEDRTCHVASGAVVFVTSEASWPTGYYSENPGRMEFLSQFHRIYTPHDVYLPQVRSAMPFLPWMVNANHGPSINAPHNRDVNALLALRTPEKSRGLSVFCSTQTLTPEHRLRVRFVEKLKEEMGDALDWFGNGVHSVAEKWEGLAPYRYTLVLENRSTPDVITEKLGDAFLTYTYPLYWGAPNASGYFPPQSFTPINIRNFPESLETIRQVAESDLHVERYGDMIRARELVLGDLHQYTRMSQIAQELMSEGRQSRTVSLRTKDELENRPPSSFTSRLLRRR